ncbi:hypothetical protein [Flavobacterium fluviale]|uniref:Uncharacterized protein n=1 Tax=Flavobacterium fluviale TaxID=2249356 RepID=A0A344LSF7_9FLAO|nr:hypothetical protein [Flavobacterium fluviale]AXB56849.1 hypothetical protein HYN86_09700 [Flavobacterium fluviale]
MAKKKINIILILVVLGLWGTVGYRAIKNYFGNNDGAVNTEIGNHNVSLKKINKDTFDLKKVGRDPFLNKQFEEKQVSSAVLVSYHPIKKIVTPSIPKPSSNINWPQLKYFGYLKSNNQELVLLKIDSKLHKLKLNDEVNGLVVKKKYKDSIEVFFNSQRKTIHIN